MKVGECCKREVIAIKASADAREAATLMREEHVGFLVVYRDDDELRKPVGVLTDRDLVLTVMARDVNPEAVAVRDVMSQHPIIARENDELSDLLQAMRIAGIRRVPLVDTRDALVGIVAIDDTIDVIAKLMGDIVGSIKSGQQQEWRTRAF